MTSVEHKREMATTAAMPFWWKCLEFHDEKTFQIKFLCSLLVLALVLLYGSYCFSVRRLLSKVIQGFLHHVTIHHSTLACFVIVQQLLNGVYLCAITRNQQNRSRNGVCCQPIRGYDHVNKGITDKSCLAIFSGEFSNKVANNRKTGKDSSVYIFQPPLL